MSVTEAARRRGGAQIEQSQQGTGSNHAISALKFRILREFLELGYSVLLSDIDVVWLDVSPPPPLFSQPGMQCLRGPCRNHAAECFSKQTRSQIQRGAAGGATERPQP